MPCFVAFFLIPSGSLSLKLKFSVLSRRAGKKFLVILPYGVGVIGMYIGATDSTQVFNACRVDTLSSHHLVSKSLAFPTQDIVLRL